MELYRSAAGFTLNDDTTGERNAQNLEAGSKEPYPNLGTVPPPPDRAMSSIDRQKLQQGLADDRMQAKQTDANLRGSGTASNAPTPITRPSSSAGGAAASDSKRHVDGALPGGHSNANAARRRSSPGSDQVVQETALSSPAVHAMPEGDTPRAAPPPPSLPPPEQPRKPVADRAKPTQGATANRSSQQAAAARPGRPATDAASPAPADTAKTPPATAEQAARIPPLPSVAATTPGTSWPPPLGLSDTPKSPSEKSPAALPPRPAADAGSPSPANTAKTPPATADETVRIAPLPPADMMSPPDKAAGTAPLLPQADAPSTAKAGTAPPPSVAATTPGASWPPPLGPSDTPKSPSEKIAAALPPRPEAGAGSRSPADAAKTPPAPADEAVRIPPLPPADMMSPPDKAAVTAPVPPPANVASTAKASAVPPPPAAVAATPGASWPPPLAPGDTSKSPSERTAALDATQPPQQPPLAPAPAAAKAPEQQAALAPVPQAAPRTGKPSVVSLQAAEINFAANGLTLTPEDDRRLADVVKLYDKHGGIVRVVGYGRRGYGADAAQQELASFSKAIERANVVAKALAGLGLASNRIVVQAAPVGDGLGEDRAEVLLEF